MSTPAADLLEQQDANAFNIAAYQRAADTLRPLKQDLAALIERLASQV